MRLQAVVILAFALACHPRPAGHRHTVEPSPDRRAWSMPLDDWRRPFLGRWSVELQIEKAGNGSLVGRRIGGTIELRDTLLSDFPALGPSATVRFNGIEDLSPPCFESHLGIVGMSPGADSVYFDFSPRCRDNNLIAYGRAFHDSIIGYWQDAYGFANPTMGGSFRMIRAR